MSSFKNAYKGRTHKERSQLSTRKQLGILEKHKDYKIRAVDFHKKEKRIKDLRKKAEFQNPNEYSTKMVNAQQKDGKHFAATESGVIPEDTLKLLKTQDSGYIELKRQIETKKIERLKESVHCVGASEGRNTHTVFVDSKAEARAFKPAEYFDTHPSLVSQAHNRLSTAQLTNPEVAKSLDASRKMSKKLDKAKAKVYEELTQRQKRVAQLSRATDEVQVHRNLMSKGRRKKVRGRTSNSAPVYKWKTERKK